MQNFTDYLSSGHVWLYVPVAILLGALHGLEPGHSKTMMAAFIIAIRGTIWQAVLLGLSAAISHSLLIWVLAALALNYGSQWDAETVEPWLQIGSAILILALAIWMFFRTRREVAEAHAHDHGNSHGHAHDHSHPPVTQAASLCAPHPHTTHIPDPSFPHDLSLPAGFHAPTLTAKRTHAPLPEGKQAGPQPPPERTHTPHHGMLLDTGHGWLEIAIITDSATSTSRFHIHPCTATGSPLPLPKGNHLTLETARLDGSVQLFKFEPVSTTHWEATAPVPAPHDFTATLTLGHSDHAHTYRLKFSAPATATPGQPSAPVIAEEIQPAGDVYQDAHERAHAEDIARRFASRSVTTPQIILFGITGGLMPCPAAFTILLVCLQLKKVALGFAIVGAFSFGLALTMVTVGAAAAWSVQRAQKRFTGFGDWMRKAPYISCLLLTLLALYMAWSGYHALSHPHTH